MKRLRHHKKTLQRLTGKAENNTVYFVMDDSVSGEDDQMEIHSGAPVIHEGQILIGSIPKDAPADIRGGIDERFTAADPEKDRQDEAEKTTPAES